MKHKPSPAIRSGLACALGVGLQMTACTSKPADTKSAQPASSPTVPPLSEPQGGAKIGKAYRDSTPGQRPGPPAAPKGAPNVQIVLVDDAGTGSAATLPECSFPPETRRLFGVVTHSRES